MSKRLQVLLDDEEYRAIQAIAKAARHEFPTADIEDMLREIGA